jgi:hypothetical protein
MQGRITMKGTAGTDDTTVGGVHNNIEVPQRYDFYENQMMEYRYPSNKTK